MECSNGKYRLSTKNTMYSAQEKYTRWRAVFPCTFVAVLMLRAECSLFRSGSHLVIQVLQSYEEIPGNCFGSG